MKNLLHDMTADALLLGSIVTTLIWSVVIEWRFRRKPPVTQGFWELTRDYHWALRAIWRFNVVLIIGAAGVFITAAGSLCRHLLRSIF